ncbi:HAMP domain-containing sensor histidine kinase [Microvirga sp. W0021]|uniref:histidine kinase n=1 Tax=Hohaiivirga grylli TaxID=3133970 RepID=A0ABV0BGZ7_9HYPH
MHKERRKKWRPSMGLIVFVVLGTVLALPLVGLFFFRLYENQLIRETEAELIAQSAAISAVFAQKIEALPPEKRVLGAPAISFAKLENGSFQPIPTSLDLAVGPILSSRPDAQPALEAPSAANLKIGEELQEVLQRTQTVTLAGFRLLDAKGVVISGREEIGQSLAHIEEIHTALNGAFMSMLRVRAVNRPAPPLYSISRGTGVRIFTAMPVIVDGRVAGVVYASRTPDNIVKHMYAERKKYILAALAILLVTGIIGLIFVRLISRPIHGLVRRAGEIGRREEDPVPLKHYGTREIALLGEGLDDMAQRLRERSDYIATFAAHVSHEIKTPLTSMQGAAELLRDAPDMSEEERNKFLDNIIADTSRLTDILHRLRELARADNPQTSGISELENIAADLRIGFPKLTINIVSDAGQAIPMAHENVMIVVSHLADNAQQHGASRLDISTFINEKNIHLRIEDNGEGISERNRDKIFDSFFTTRRERGGTGMGLRIASAMLQSHGGVIRLRDDVRIGTAFELVLPVSA